METKIMDTLYSVLAQPRQSSFSNFIQSKLDELGITRNYLCKAIQVENKSLSRIMNGEAQKVDIVTIIKLGDFMGIDFREFVQHFIAELDSNEIKKIESARKAGIILRNFDLVTLKKIGFIKSISNFELIEKRINRFFNLESLLQYEQVNLKLQSLFSRTKNNSSEKMLKFWCATAREELKIIANPYPFDLFQIKSIITKLSRLTSNEKDGLFYAVRSLFHAGVTVLINPYIGKTQIRGATFIVNGKPCIVLQDFRRNYDTIWFALAHELCHIIKDLPLISRMNFHITLDKSEPDFFIDDAIEKRANDFASEILLPEKHLKYIASFIDVPGMVTKIARELSVSESIIYGQYAKRYNKPIYYSKTKKAEIAIRNLMIKNLYEVEEITSAIEPLTKVYN